jgi:hypothetical protein
MGLDFSHGGAHFSYGGFMDFRIALAKEIGIPDLRAMKGFGGDISWDDITDPLKDLLYHSDCEGHLTPTQCKKIAPRLREIVDGWEKTHGVDSPFCFFIRTETLKLADGMVEAAKNKERFEFC